MHHVLSPVRAACFAALSMVASVVGVASAQPVLITASQTISPGQTTITPTAGGAAVPMSTAQITVSGSSTFLTINGAHSIASLTLQGNGRVTHSPGFTFTADLGQGAVTVGGFWLTTSGDVTINAGSSIDVSGRGYGPRVGPGAGGNASSTLAFGSGAGGSYGGNAAFSVNGFDGVTGTTYGNFAQPSDLGSGGGDGYTSGNLNTGWAGGGAVRLIVGGTLTNIGGIRANGRFGNLNGGAGAGGSVWLATGTLTGTGTIEANGARSTGTDSNATASGGGRIAVYARTTSHEGIIRAFGGGSNDAGPGTVFRAFEGQSAELRYDNGGGGGVTRLHAPVVLPANADFVLASNVRLGHAARSPAGLRIEVGGNMTLESESRIDVSGLGYGPNAGPGAGGNATAYPNQANGSGGSYGGSAGVSGSQSIAGSGPTYGSFAEPSDLGSGGGNGLDSPRQIAPGGSGGGAVRLLVGGRLTLHGDIRANGNSLPDNSVGGQGGGGSGGSVWLTAGEFAGAGTVEANGGGGTDGSATGGGGRIAVYATTTLYTGTLRALSANRSVIFDSGPGTIYRAFGGQPAELRYEGIGTTRLSEPLIVPNNGNLVLAGSIRLEHGRGDTNGLRIEVGGDMTINSGASIDVSGRGYGPGAGPGAGGDATRPPPGLIGYGADGSYGGSAEFMQEPSSGLTRPTYGSFAEPSDLGSGGGSGYPQVGGGLTRGYAGGGAIRLIVGGTFTLHGTVLSNGEGAADGPGSGSGGSVWVTAGTFVGTGSIRADGASLAGGGRIAVYATSSTHSGTVRARGAGSGTVYRSIAGQPAELRYDSGGMTRLYEPLVLRGNTNLVLTGNTRLDHAPGDTRGLHIEVEGNMTIDSGSSIDVSGRGYGPNTGPGAGGNASNIETGYGAGGSYGGSAALSTNPNDGVAGPTYGSAVQPSDLGSGGGNTTGTGVLFRGGAGGGAVRVVVGGTLMNHGAIRANGDGVFFAGSGSGGSVWITAGTFAGAGSVQANGLGLAGGGRVAVYSCLSSFLGTVQALRGGTGAQNGTVVVSNVSVRVSQVSQALCSGTSAVLGADAGGVGALAYRWRKNAIDLVDGPTGTGSTIRGSRDRQLVVDNVNGPDSGDYTVVVTAACGSVTSNAAGVRIVGSDLSVCDSLDFNRDCLYPDDADLIALLNVLAGGECESCADIDFNNDGCFPDDADQLAFLRVLAGGACE